jgi:uncharacterized protein (DUF2384 family)
MKKPQNGRRVTAANVDDDLLRAVASRLHVSEKLLRKAASKQEVSVTDTAFVQRTDRLRSKLEHELGGKEELRVWLKAGNDGLDGKRPVDFIEDGRIDVLERVQKALKGLQFG